LRYFFRFTRNYCKVALLRGAQIFCQLTFGSLFAGIGGFDLGFERAGMACKWQVEINDYATKVLEKHWPNVHRERDIQECGRHNLQQVDVICGGFPCQDISYAGLGAGLDGERSGLFFEALRVVRELRPRAVVLENVAALLTRGLDRVLGSLASIGFDAEWHCIPAAAVGALHIRDRVFILGYANGNRWNARKQARKATRHWIPAVATSSYASSMADTDGTRLEKRQGQNTSGARSNRWPELVRSEWWEFEPAVGRSLDGFSGWLDGHQRLTFKSHKRIMAYVINHEGIKNGNATKERTEEVLRDLRNRFDPKGFQLKTGGFVGISSQEVLFAHLCKHTTDTADEAWLQLSCEEASWQGVRSVWTQQELASASHRSGQGEQQQREHPDSMQTLSRLLAHDARAAWMEYCGEDAKTVLSEWGPGWESGIARVANGIPARVDRLRGLGNAVVPQVAEYVGRRVVEVLTA
jgi:DNA (cytosine-5)-methyltransferase 1